jgi:hypothetical protein
MAGSYVIHKQPEMRENLLETFNLAIDFWIGALEEYSVKPVMHQTSRQLVNRANVYAPVG